MPQLNYQTTTHGSHAEAVDEPAVDAGAATAGPNGRLQPLDGASVCRHHPSLPALAELLGSLREGGAVRLVADLVDALPVPAVLTDCSREYRFIYGNAAWSSQSDRPGGHEGRPLAEILETVGENPFPPALWRVWETGQPGHFRGFPCVGMIGARVCLPGDVTMWDWDAYPLGGGRGHATHMLVVLRDVTDRHLRQAQLRARHEADGHLKQEELTAREQEVAELIACGLRNPAIATRLHISRTTVASHVTRILQKLGFTTRAQIAAWVVEQRLVERTPA
jgi:DNA-binding CsgD family transcriptional regulator/PAS domain-containing protein